MLAVAASEERVPKANSPDHARRADHDQLQHVAGLHRVEGDHAVGVEQLAPGAIDPVGEVPPRCRGP